VPGRIGQRQLTRTPAGIKKDTIRVDDEIRVSYVAESGTIRRRVKSTTAQSTGETSRE
jgi:hypothetical protein